MKPSKEKLAELEQQRNLLRRHLQWLENEILDCKRNLPENRLLGSPAHEAGVPDMAPPIKKELPTFVPKHPPSRDQVEEGPSIGEDPNPEEVSSDLMDTLGPDISGSVGSSKKGCVTLFASAMLILGAFITYICFFYGK